MLLPLVAAAARIVRWGGAHLVSGWGAAAHARGARGTHIFSEVEQQGDAFSLRRLVLFLFLFHAIFTLQVQLKYCKQFV